MVAAMCGRGGEEGEGAERADEGVEGGGADGGEDPGHFPSSTPPLLSLSFQFLLGGIFHQFAFLTVLMLSFIVPGGFVLSHLTGDPIVP